VITIRRARAGEGRAIAAVHVASWRSTYAGILPDAYLAGLSLAQHAAAYEATIAAGIGVLVAVAGEKGARRVVGFATCAPNAPHTTAPGEGEIETLYVLDDWRERGIGRRLLRAAGALLAASGCRSAFVRVLSDNPNRWFYACLGGEPQGESLVRVGGIAIPQTAYVWRDIARIGHRRAAHSPAPPPLDSDGTAGP
jgi:hypothetical protein